MAAAEKGALLNGVGVSEKLNALLDECENIVDGRKVYSCKFCGKIYDIKSSMRYHLKIIHLQLHLRTTDMQCKVCGKRFTCISAVNRHQEKCQLRAPGFSSSESFDGTNQLQQELVVTEADTSVAKFEEAIDLSIST